MTDEAKRTYPPGVPCWVDVEQPDLRAGTEFYGALFDWDFTDAADADAPGDDPPYLFATLDGLDAAGLEAGDSGAGWVSYIATDDIGRACVDVERAGGIVGVPPAGGASGLSATCADPQGAVFRLWQAGTHTGSQIANVPGAWNFSDLRTPDAAASLAFYGKVFGWRHDHELGAGMLRLPGYGDHLAATIDPEIHERQASAPPGFADVVAGLTPDAGAPTATWDIRFTVANRNASVTQAERLGATVVSRADTEWTKEAVILDPQGARLVLSQFAPPEDAGF
ncbi:VOC family protein [Microbacterium sp.]|uniref:VOC family protein n=1 Tax=Microbacterium sp. TaxID=51671 RepID=UPI002E377B68|nr:VOC family protein [Microbacterium sp.]HEX5730598.1 VOC family protein [Microbacterium sp.]